MRKLGTEVSSQHLFIYLYHPFRFVWPSLGSSLVASVLAVSMPVMTAVARSLFHWVPVFSPTISRQQRLGTPVKVPALAQMLRCSRRLLPCLPRKNLGRRIGDSVQKQHYL
jgi:hypothetical protein